MEPVLTFDEIAAAFRSGGLELSICRTVTRDDLIRLVVGMQWVDACMAFHVLTSAMSSFGVSGDVVVTMDQELVDELRPAVDIVDEWLGVR